MCRHALLSYVCSHTKTVEQNCASQEATAIPEYCPFYIFERKASLLHCTDCTNASFDVFKHDAQIHLDILEVEEYRLAGAHEVLTFQQWLTTSSLVNRLRLGQVQTVIDHLQMCSPGQRNVIHKAKKLLDEVRRRALLEPSQQQERLDLQAAAAYYVSQNEERPLIRTSSRPRSALHQSHSDLCHPSQVVPSLHIANKPDTRPNPSQKVTAASGTTPTTPVYDVDAPSPAAETTESHTQTKHTSQPLRPPIATPRAKPSDGRAVRKPKITQTLASRRPPRRQASKPITYAENGDEEPDATEQQDNMQSQAPPDKTSSHASAANGTLTPNRKRTSNRDALSDDSELSAPEDVSTPPSQPARMAKRAGNKARVPKSKKAKRGGKQGKNKHQRAVTSPQTAPISSPLNAVSDVNRPRSSARPPTAERPVIPAYIPPKQATAVPSIPQIGVNLDDYLDSQNRPRASFTSPRTRSRQALYPAEPSRPTTTVQHQPRPFDSTRLMHRQSLPPIQRLPVSRGVFDPRPNLSRFPSSTPTSSSTGTTRRTTNEGLTHLPLFTPSFPPASYNYSQQPTFPEPSQTNLPPPVTSDYIDPSALINHRAVAPHPSDNLVSTFGSSSASNTTTHVPALFGAPASRLPDTNFTSEDFEAAGNIYELAHPAHHIHGQDQEHQAPTSGLTPPPRPQVYLGSDAVSNEDSVVGADGVHSTYDRW